MKEGTKVSLVTVKQAMQIAMKKVEDFTPTSKIGDLMWPSCQEAYCEWRL